MNFDNQIDYILKFLNITQQGITFENIEGHGFKELPEGWKHLPDAVRVLASHFDVHSEIIVNRYTVELGLLRFHLEPPTEPLYEFIFNSVAQAVAAKSAKICLVCGNSGVRRKDEQHWPCLCGKHYIQYRNWLDQNGHY